MPLIVDCYNLLHADMPPALAGLDEGRLCRLLAMSRHRGAAMTVVCDGGVKPRLAEHSPVDAVELRYAGVGRSADEVIMAMIAADSGPRRLVVVTDDREIQKAARRRRAKVLPCAAMVAELARVAERLERPGGQGAGQGGGDAKPTLGADAADVESWAKLFGVDPDRPIDPREGRRRGEW
jgi:predicted RNA-binding protein with PIN domain